MDYLSSGTETCSNCIIIASQRLFLISDLEYSKTTVIHQVCRHCDNIVAWKRNQDLTLFSRLHPIHTIADTMPRCLIVVTAKAKVLQDTLVFVFTVSVSHHSWLLRRAYRMAN